MLTIRGSIDDNRRWSVRHLMRFAYPLCVPLITTSTKYGQQLTLLTTNIVRNVGIGENIRTWFLINGRVSDSWWYTFVIASWFRENVNFAASVARNTDVTQENKTIVKKIGRDSVKSREFYFFFLSLARKSSPERTWTRENVEWSFSNWLAVCKRQTRYSHAINSRQKCRSFVGISPFN